MYEQGYPFRLNAKVRVCFIHSFTLLDTCTLVQALFWRIMLRCFVAPRWTKRVYVYLFVQVLAYAAECFLQRPGQQNNLHTCKRRKQVFLQSTLGVPCLSNTKVSMRYLANPQRHTEVVNR